MRDLGLQLRLIQLPRRAKRLITASIDAALLTLALAASIFLTHEYSLVAILERWPVFILLLAIALPAFALNGLYRAIIRFIGARLVFGVLRSISLATVSIAATSVWLIGDPAAQALSGAMIFWSFALLAVVGSRFMMRTYLVHQAMTGQRVAIYGAGEAGARLVAALTGGNEFVPVAFVDDNLAVQGRSLNGVQIYHPDLLPRLVEELSIKRVLLALPSVSRHKRQQIIANLEHLPVHVQTLPDISDLVSGNARVDDIREVDVADLLGRDPVPPREHLLDACIRGKSVIVTGAGGSIGSELCRQIVHLGPRQLLLFEMSELALYQIEKELRLITARDNLDVEILALLGSAHHRQRLREILKTFDVDTLYHAAAYKHVPMVEHNMVEGVHNNIIGTWYTAEAAADAGIETFVLISTDKAVSPVNVMGATKRFAEMVLQGLDERGSRTKFCMVRFGNVLASSGSVVPLFREQVRRGGPVTVTHPEIIRYFMTIPEAAQLVIQAGSMSKGGDVFVLDMGKPIRIVDLARRMIKLMGLTARDDENPDGDIPIEYTGLRPAEKLYEELLIGNNVMGTEHPMIMRAMEESLPWHQVESYLTELLSAAANFDCERTRDLLLDSVNGYSPSNGVDDIVWRAARQEAAQAASVVTELASRRPSGTAA
jgi:FlaA1/EpsC-like NDP-sugar epimerase